MERLDVYELLRQAHSYMKDIGGNTMGKSVMREAMINKKFTLPLTNKEKILSFKYINEIRNRLYKLEKIYAKQ